MIFLAIHLVIGCLLSSRLGKLSLVMSPILDLCQLPIHPVRRFMNEKSPSAVKNDKILTIFWFLQMAGLISVASRFFPTVMILLRQLAAKAQGHPDHEPATHTQTLASQSFRSQTPTRTSTSTSTMDSSVSSNDSSETGVEYSSPQLTRRRVTNVEHEEFSWSKSSYSDTSMYNLLCL